MKKTRFFLTALLLMTVLTFTGCGNRADNQDPVAGDQNNNTIEQDVNDGANDVKDDAENLGDDIKDGIDDAADDVKDAVDGDDDKKNKNSANDSTENKTDESTVNGTDNGRTGQ